MTPTVITKLYTRQHSIFYCYVWNNSDQEGMRHWLDIEIKNNLFIGEGRSGRVSVWYDLTQFNIYKIIAQKINNDPEYFRRVEKKFYNYWHKLTPYLGKQKIKSIEELESFFNLFIKWWSPMAVIISISGIENIPEPVKHSALRMRQETQEYSDEGDKIYLEAFSRLFPQYGDIKMVISPDELFGLKSGPLSDSMLSTIKQRLGGFFIFEGIIFPKDSLKQILTEHNLDLGDDNNEEKNREIKG